MQPVDQKQAFLEKLILEHSSVESSVFSKKAFDHFLEIGLPCKKCESYKYFPLAKVYEDKPLQEKATLLKNDVKEKVLPECQGSYIVLHNGLLNLELSDISRISKAISIEKLESSQSAFMPFVHAKLIQRQKMELDPFALYCQASLKGLLVLIKDDMKLEAPLQIITYFDSSKYLPTCNIYLHLGKNARSEIIHTSVHCGEGPSTSFVDLDLDQGAICAFTRLHADSLSIMLDHMSVYLKKEAKVDIYDLIMPKVPAKFHVHVQHLQPHSESTLHALSLIDEKNEYHISTNFEHLAKEAQSSQHIKTVLASKAKASFEGQIHVHKEALFTQSYQKHASLMLGEHGTINSRPNLRIFADDVKASHGATIAELDQDSLFYLKTRGLDEKTAKKLLLDGFCQEMIQNLGLDSLKEEATMLLERIDSI
jgi:Fe-S cluster assembly protein SufD